MPITSAPAIRSVCRVSLGALLAIATVPLLWATPASAGPRPVPGVAPPQTAPSPVSLPTSSVEPAVDSGATPPGEADRCRSEAAALTLALRDAGMSAQGASYAEYVLVEECEDLGEID